MDRLLSKISDCIKTKNYLEAEEIGWTLYKQNKDNLKVIKILALVLLLQGKNYGSLDLYLTAYKKQPDDNDVVTNLAHLYLKIEEFQKSFDFAEKSVHQNESNHAPFVTLVELYIKKREFEKAYDYAQLLLQKIDYYTLKNNSSICFLVLDAFLAADKNAEALKLINYIYQKDFDPDIFYYHSSFSPETIKKDILDKANQYIKKSNYNNLVEKGKAVAPLYFGLANFYDKQGDQKLSDENFKKGNELIAEIQRYQPLINQQIIKNIKIFFQEDRNTQTKPSSEENLIFILGMLRSGTTLVESIIASAKGVISGGELRSINELVKAKYEESEDQLVVSDPGSVYLERIKFIRGGNTFFVDKLPGNYHNIGFIRKAFPSAKIIHVRRDPWDNAISLFKQFYVSNIPFASTFFSLGIVYANYEEIMRFWAEEMGIDFFTVQYEDLVRDNQSMGNKIFEYCKIPQEYKPSERGRFFARTASKNQVTKDIHTNSLKKTAFSDLRAEFYKSLENQRNYWKN